MWAVRDAAHASVHLACGAKENRAWAATANVVVGSDSSQSFDSCLLYYRNHYIIAIAYLEK